MAVAEAEVGSAGMVADKSPHSDRRNWSLLLSITPMPVGVFKALTVVRHAYLNAEGVAHTHWAHSVRFPSTDFAPTNIVLLRPSVISLMRNGCT